MSRADALKSVLLFFYNYMKSVPILLMIYVMTGIAVSKGSDSISFWAAEMSLSCTCCVQALNDDAELPPNQCKP